MSRQKLDCVFCQSRILCDIIEYSLGFLLLFDCSFVYTMAGKGQALVEFEDMEASTGCVEYTQVKTSFNSRS